MSFDNRTPAQREADARVNAQIANDVAAGMAARAENEAVRADVNAVAADINADEARRQAERANTYAAHNTRQALAMEDARRDRDRATYDGAVAREKARNASLAAWLLGGILATALLLGLVWSMNRDRSDEVASTTTTRTTTVSGDAGNASSAVRPQPTPVAPATVVVPVPVAPTPAPAPVTRVVPVPVPVPVPQQSAAPAPAPAAPAAGGDADAPLQGYTVPSTDSDVAAPAGGASTSDQ